METATQPQDGLVASLAFAVRIASHLSMHSSFVSAHSNRVSFDLISIGALQTQHISFAVKVRTSSPSPTTSAVPQYSGV